MRDRLRLRSRARPSSDDPGAAAQRAKLDRKAAAELAKRDDRKAAAELAKLREELIAVRCLLLGMHTFEFRGRKYSYVAHDLGNTFRHERAVELAIARQAVIDATGGAVLEVGSVLRHHFPELTHRVVDKYERAEGVENIDVMDVDGEYDLIVSVSTLEHVGHDEPVVDGVAAQPRGAGTVDAIAHLRTCLRPGGVLLFTSPIGYNPKLDEALAAGIPEVETHFLRRADLANRWVEADWAVVADVRYAEPYRNANAIMVGLAQAPH